jgi:hypothetical protein
LVSPPKPEINPLLEPEETKTVWSEPKFKAPPVNVPRVVTLPFRFNTPPITLVRLAEPATVRVPLLTLVTVADPPTVKEPPLNPEVVAAPETVTLPADTLPPKLRLLANRVLPAPARLANVIVPLVALKSRLLAAVFALVTLLPERFRPVPETVALPDGPSVKVAFGL